MSHENFMFYRAKINTKDFSLGNYEQWEQMTVKLFNPIIGNFSMENWCNRKKQLQINISCDSFSFVWFFVCLDDDVFGIFACRLKTYSVSNKYLVKSSSENTYNFDFSLGFLRLKVIFTGRKLRIRKAPSRRSNFRRLGL